MSGHLDGPPPGPPDPPYIPGDLGAPSAKEFARRRAGDRHMNDNPYPNASDTMHYELHTAWDEGYAEGFAAGRAAATPDPPPDDLCAVVFRALHSSRNTQMSDEMRAAYIASVITAEEGAWPDQSAMHGVLLEQVKDAYTAGITDTVAKLRVRAANMLPEVASFTMDEIEAILGHAAPGICCAPHCWSEYGTPCGDCPADAERERQSDE